MDGLWMSKMDGWIDTMDIEKKIDGGCLFVIHLDWRIVIVSRWIHWLSHRLEPWMEYILYYLPHTTYSCHRYQKKRRKWPLGASTLHLRQHWRSGPRRFGGMWNTNLLSLGQPSYHNDQVAIQWLLAILFNTFLSCILCVLILKIW